MKQTLPAGLREDCLLSEHKLEGQPVSEGIEAVGDRVRTSKKNSLFYQYETLQYNSQGDVDYFLSHFVNVV